MDPQYDINVYELEWIVGEDPRSAWSMGCSGVDLLVQSDHTSQNQKIPTFLYCVEGKTRLYTTAEVKIDRDCLFDDALLLARIKVRSAHLGLGKIPEASHSGYPECS